MTNYKENFEHLSPVWTHQSDIIVDHAEGCYIYATDGRKILDFACGDKEFWIINGNENFAYVKPAKTGATTNLNLITASGNIYTFVLIEVSGSEGAEPDLKVFVEPTEQSMISTADKSARFLSTHELDTYRQQIDADKEEIRRLNESARAAIDSQVGKFLSALQFSYHFESNKKPFNIRAIFNDEHFTYIKGSPDETPSLYEVRDKKPNLLNFTFKDGTYIADRVINHGYLVIGKNFFQFVRHE